MTAKLTDSIQPNLGTLTDTERLTLIQILQSFTTGGPFPCGENIGFFTRLHVRNCLRKAAINERGRQKNNAKLIAALTRKLLG